MMWTAHTFLAVAVFNGMVFASAEDSADYSEYYKNYYETHSAQERQPAFSRQSFASLATPETAVCLFIFNPTVIWYQFFEYQKCTQMIYDN